jgi:phosphosulfolactate synthase (CoM biosynthesis protein A)
MPETKVAWPDRGRSLAQCPRHRQSNILFDDASICAVCYVSTGGYIERVLAASAGDEDVLTRYLRKCKDLGLDVLELSSGVLSLPTDD